MTWNDTLQPRRAADERLLLDLPAVAREVYCSTRHFQRLVDAGRAPQPVRLGALVRWPRETIERWVRLGCPDLRERANR